MSVGFTPSASAATAPDGTARHLGRWNYDQPDFTTMTNIAELDVPGGLQVPQIGDIVYTSERDGRLVGRTDVGCTWRFRGTSGALELDPPDQFCHNRTLNVAYTINRWTVTTSGQRQRETIEATSHHGDRDVAFVLCDGARTRSGAANTRAFLGSWTYGAADPATDVNKRTTTRSDQPPAAPAERGTTRTPADYDNRITARTPDDCTWTLLVRGNTSQLARPCRPASRAAPRRSRSTTRPSPATGTSSSPS